MITRAAFVPTLLFAALACSLDNAVLDGSALSVEIREGDYVDWTLISRNPSP